MMRHRVGAGVLAVVVMATFGPRVEAQQPAASPGDVTEIRGELARLRAEFDEVRRQYGERLAQLEARLAALGAAPAPPAIQAPPASEPPSSPIVLPPASARVFNPDMSVNGNFLGSAGKNPFTPEPSLQLREVEVSLQAVVDPYARADFFLAAGPEGLEIEEGYATFTALPRQFLLKAGKLRAQFGKVNTLHTHAMPTADRPLVTMNLLGGTEGLSDSGVSLSKLVNNPFVFLEATAEVYAGTSDVFQSARRTRPTYVGRLRAYDDLSEDKNIEVGGSYAFGQTDVGAADGLDLHKQLFGLDATFRYRPLRRAIYQRLNLRTELIWSRQQLPGSVHTTAFGLYGLGEYQFARRWYVGARLDRSGRVLDGTQFDWGGSGFLTFWPTEFSQVRGQFRRTSFAEGVRANELLFQLNFSIGAHAAHAF